MYLHPPPRTRRLIHCRTIHTKVWMKVDGQPREPIGAIYSNPCCKTRCCAEDIVEAYMTNGKHGEEEIQIGEPFFADTPPTPSSSFMTRCHSNSCQKLSGSVLRRAMLSLGPGLHALRDYAGQLLLLPHNHVPGMLRRAVLSPASTTRVLYLLPLRVWYWSWDSANRWYNGAN